MTEHKRMTARFVGRATEATTHAAVEVRRTRLQAELERIVRVLVEQYDPECVILMAPSHTATSMSGATSTCVSSSGRRSGLSSAWKRLGY
jgi:hypothetical protein